MGFEIDEPKIRARAARLDAGESDKPVDLWMMLPGLDRIAAAATDADPMAGAQSRADSCRRLDQLTPVASLQETRTPSAQPSSSGACPRLIPMTRRFTLDRVTPAVRDGSRAAIRRRL